jgi:lauroyl/myristoyl acyltransferase
MMNVLGELILRHSHRPLARIAQHMSLIESALETENAARISEGLRLAYSDLDARAIQKLTTDNLKFFARLGVEQYHLATLSRGALRKYCDEITLDPATEDLRIMLEPGPKIICGPHLGNYAGTVLKGALLHEGLKELYVFFNPPDRNPFSATMLKLFETLGTGARPILNSPRGIVTAMKALKNGANLVIMPDVVLGEGPYIYAPLFGRYSKCMLGTAFFAHRTEAPLYTGYSIFSGRSSALTFRKNAATPKTEIVGEDPLFAIARSVYASLEEAISRAPAQWTFWARYGMNTLITPRVPRP